MNHTLPSSELFIYFDARYSLGSIDEPEDKGSRSSEPGNWNHARGEKKTREAVFNVDNFKR